MDGITELAAPTHVLDVQVPPAADPMRMGRTDDHRHRHHATPEVREFQIADVDEATRTRLLDRALSLQPRFDYSSHHDVLVVEEIGEVAILLGKGERRLAGMGGNLGGGGDAGVAQEGGGL